MNNRTLLISMSVFILGLMLIIANYLGAEPGSDAPNVAVSMSEHALPSDLTIANSTGGTLSSTQTTKIETITENTSLADTKPPAFFNLVGGSVVQDETQRAIFEYFLAMDGEISIADIKTRLARYAATVLNDQQINDVLNAFAKYHAYLEFMRDNQQAADSHASFRDTFDWIRQQRRVFFGEQLAEAYFGYEEAYDTYSLAKLDIMSNTHLDQQDKSLALQHLITQLPPEIQNRQQQKSAVYEAIADNQQLSMSMRGDALYQSRMDNFGYEAAERLKDLDNERRAWDQRYAWYRDEATAILESNLTNKDKAQAIERLRRSHFNDREVLRVATLDKMR